MAVDFDGSIAYNGLMNRETHITAQEFRSDMITLIRAFDNWAYKDQLANPSDYDQYTFNDWLELFETFLENKND